MRSSNQDAKGHLFLFCDWRKAADEASANWRQILKVSSGRKKKEVAKSGKYQTLPHFEKLD